MTYSLLNTYVFTLLYFFKRFYFQICLICYHIFELNTIVLFFYSNISSLSLSSSSSLVLFSDFSFNKSLISSNKTTSSGFGAGASSFFSSLCVSLLTILTKMKIQNATIRKSITF